MEHEQYAAFAAWMKSLRLAADMTQEELAKEVHVSYRTARYWEAGISLPNELAWRELTKLALSIGHARPPVVNRRRGPMIATK